MTSSSDSSRFSGTTEMMFRADLDDVPLTQLAEISAALGVVADVAAARRKLISERLNGLLLEGDTGDVETSVSESGKSIQADIENITLRRTESGGGSKVNVDLVMSLLEEKEIDSSRVVKVKSWVLDEAALDALLAEHGIDKQSLMKPASFEVDEPILSALVTMGHITEAEFDSVHKPVKPRVSVTCTFDKKTKAAFISTLEAKEGDVVRRRNS